MADYSNTFGGAAKDAANSTILGADFDTEFDAIATASATKANKTGAPATTNNLAMLTATGDLADSLVETDGSGNITANVTGNVTGASTIDVDAITADTTNGNLSLSGNGTGIVTTDTLSATTTNGDLAITRNGTGDITVDSTPIYGMVILDSPQRLISSTGSVSWSTFDMSAAGGSAATAATAGAVTAILQLYVRHTGATIPFITTLSVRKTGTTPTYVSFASVEGPASDEGRDTNEVHVNLDGNSDFDYQVNTIGGGTATHEVYLIGYYV